MRVTPKLKTDFVSALLFLLASNIMSYPAWGQSKQDDLDSTSSQSSPPSSPFLPSLSQQNAPLHGGVMKEDTGQENTERKPLLGFLSRHKMSADDYRKLEYGVLGIVAEKSFFSRYYTVTELLRGCPAALAGIREGDLEVQVDDHAFTRQDDQRVYWTKMCGKAGTPVDVVIKRRGELITYHLIRMNIEDIQNDRVRRMYERMLSHLGPPGQ